MDSAAAAWVTCTRGYRGRSCCDPLARKSLVWGVNFVLVGMVVRRMEEMRKRWRWRWRRTRGKRLEKRWRGGGGFEKASERERNV